MTIDEYEPDDVLFEISRKLANVSINNMSLDTDAAVVERDSLTTIRYYLYSNDKDLSLQSIQMLRRYLTQSNSNPENADHILKLDVLARINEMLTWSDASDIQFECAWIITNIAAGPSEQTITLVNSGVIDSLLTCLSHNSSTASTSAQVAWALSNFAGESAQLRELLMEKRAPVIVADVLTDIYNSIFDQVQEHFNVYGKIYIDDPDISTNVKALVWSLANMSRGGFKTVEHWSGYCPVFDILAKLIHFEHKDILTDACWGLSRILYSMHEVTPFYENTIISKELCTRLSQLLSNSNISIVVPALRTIINITSGPDEHSVTLLNSNLLPNIAHLMSSNVPISVRRDAFLLIGNVIVCGNTLIEKVIHDEGIMKYITFHIGVPGYAFNDKSQEWTPAMSSAYYEITEEWKITSEALTILSNIISRGSTSSLRYVLDHYPVLPDYLLHILTWSELPLAILSRCLDAIINIIERTNKTSQTHTGANPPSSNKYANDLLCHGIVNLLHLQVAIHSDKLLHARTNFLLHLLELGSEKKPFAEPAKVVRDTASLFGLNGPRKASTEDSKRRVLHGPEDGDVRLIENAIGNLSVSQSFCPS
ncbi:armadillo-type protein [Spinellus fusiger]|nr:armadillo-type protein [Spinellus fusiger]